MTVFYWVVSVSMRGNLYSFASVTVWALGRWQYDMEINGKEKTLIEKPVTESIQTTENWNSSIFSIKRRFRQGLVLL